MIHPEALKRAQAEAELTIGRNNYDRALLAAYLSDPEIRDAIKVAIMQDIDWNEVDTASEDGAIIYVLRAIGAEVSK